MTMKRVVQVPDKVVPPVPELVALPNDLTTAVKFSQPGDEDMLTVAALRSGSEPWKNRNETPEESLQALTKLRPFIQVGKLSNQAVGYVTIERDGPVPGAAYM